MGYRSFSKFRCIVIVFSLLALIFQTGCWSKDEIEDLSIIAGMGLDMANETKLEEKLDKRRTNYRKKDNVTYTLQIVDKQSEARNGDAKSDTSAKPYLNISETGDSLFEMIREFSSRLERPIIGHHLKVIIINESLSRRYDMNNLLSFMLRDNDIRLNCLVVMSSGIAREVLEAKGRSIIPAFRLFGMSDNQYRTYKILPPMSLIKLEGKMNSKSSYLLQNVIAVDGEVEFSGAAVVKGKSQKFRGRLNEEELIGVTWLRGDGKGGAVKSYDQKTKELITYELKTMKSKIVPHIEGSKISFHVNIETEGRIIEEWLVTNEPVDAKFLSKAEQTVEKEINRLIKLGLNKIQKEYKTDVVGFGTRLSIKHPKVWKKVKEDWDEEFSRVHITYDVKVKITETGTKQGH